jgi:phage-related protein (TIGR01555 family)
MSNDTPAGFDLGKIIAAAGAGRPARAIPQHLVERGRGMVDALQKSMQLRADGIYSRFDGWMNEVTGHGTTRDKTTYGYIYPDRLLVDSELSALYHYDDMAGRMVDVIPQEMFREGFGVETGEPGLNEIVKQKHRELETRTHLMDGQRWGRCFGGGATLIGLDDGRPMEEPISPESADDIDFLLTMDRRLVWPLTYYTEAGPKLGRVKQYLITTVNPGGGLAYSTAVVHESRLILHRGMSTAEQEKRQLMSWDLSIYQRAYATLRQFNTGWSSTEQLMADGSQAVYTIGGLQAIIASGGEELLHERLRVMDMFRSVVRGIVLDADAHETFERKTASLEGWPQTLQQQMLRLAAAVEMPVTILMGQSPAGMNATGESDFRWFYDRIRSMQTNTVAPMIERLTALWLRTRRGAEALAAAIALLGKKILSVVATFPNLWRETPKDRATRELTIAQRDQIYVTTQVFSPDRVALTRGRPNGFDQEVVLSDMEVKDLETRLKQSLLQPETDDAEIPEGDAPTTEAPAEDEIPDIDVAPTDLALVVTVNEVRASKGLKAFPMPKGAMTLLEYKNTIAPQIADVAAAETGINPDDPTPPAPPPFGGGGGFSGGGGPSGEEPPPDEEPAEDEEDPIDEQGRADAAPPGMRTFTLQRDEDETGVSGTGAVGFGCLFPDGRTAMRWNTKTASTTMFDSMEDVLKVHGHAGKTRVVWHDERADAGLPLDAWMRLDAASNAAQDKEAKKASKAAKEKSKDAWAKTHEAQQASKHADAHPADKGAQQKAAHANKAAASAHGAAKEAWEHAMNTARPGSGQFLAASSVVQDHDHQKQVAEKSAAAHESKASGGGNGGEGDGGGGAGEQDRDEAGRFA